MTTDLIKAWEVAFDMMLHANKRPYRHRRVAAEVALDMYFEEIEKQLLPLPAEKKP